MSSEKWNVTFIITRKKGDGAPYTQSFPLEVDPDEYVLDGVERTRPEVKAVGTSPRLLFGGGSPVPIGEYPSGTGDSGSGRLLARWGALASVGRDYFAAMEIPLLQGRLFNRLDSVPNAESVAIIDESLARKLRPQYLAKCGGTYSSEWFFSKILHCLRTAPEVFDAAIGLSGVYDMRMFLGDYEDDNVYFNSPYQYLPNLPDPWKYNHMRIIIGTGQSGAQIADELNQELASRFKGEKGRIEASLDDDLQLNAAIGLLKNKNLYQHKLGG